MAELKNGGKAVFVDRTKWEVRGMGVKVNSVLRDCLALTKDFLASFGQYFASTAESFFSGHLNLSPPIRVPSKLT